MKYGYNMNTLQFFKYRKHIAIASLVVSFQEDLILWRLKFRDPLTRKIYYITGIWFHGWANLSKERFIHLAGAQNFAKN